MSTLFNLLIGAILGFIFKYILDWIRKRSKTKGYIKILQIELTKLKEDSPGGIDDLLKKYYQISDTIAKGNDTTLAPIKQDASSFFLKWSFYPKYAFLRNNLNELHLLHQDIVNSLLKIYSLMEEFEHFKDNTKYQQILVQNLEKVQKEIPNTLELLKNEKNIISKLIDTRRKLMS